MKTNQFFKKKYITGIMIILVFIIFFLVLKNKTTGNKSAVYNKVRVKRTNLEITILSTGYVQPQNRLEIRPPIAGRIEKVIAKEGQKVKKGQILAWMSSTERAALIDAATAKGNEELKKWEELYKPTPIVAPIMGTIIQRNVESGQMFSNSDSVFVMSNRLTVKAQVDETDIAKIKLGKPAYIILDAYPDKSIPGKVGKIAFDAQTVNNVTTYIVDVFPDKVPDFMRSGMTANITFLIEKKINVITVPNSTLKIIDNTFYVMAEDNGKIIKQFIKTGLSDGKNTEILKGLKDGEIIIDEGMNVHNNKTPESENKTPFMPIRPKRKRR